MDINDIIKQNETFLTNFIETTLERYSGSKEFEWTSDLGLGFKINFAMQPILYGSYEIHIPELCGPYRMGHTSAVVRHLYIYDMDHIIRHQN